MTEEQKQAEKERIIAIVVEALEKSDDLLRALTRVIKRLERQGELRS